MCGMGVGEYIRARRLTLAGEELAHSDSKVIDIAAKYGYDSPDSFNRAFQRFHGISPSSVRKTGAELVSFAPMKIKLELEGDTMAEYRIAEKPQFTVMGVSRRFHPETSDAMIVIDLDTVMPGLMGHDFGDAIRFAANYVEEDCKDYDKVGVNLEVYGPPCKEDPGETYVELWLPVEKV